MKHWVTLVGNVASGKSTVSQAVAQELGWQHLAADELYKTNPFFELTIKDRSRWSLTSDLWFLEQRLQLLDQYADQQVIIDSGIEMSWVYASSRLQAGTMTAAEWELYQLLFQKLVGQDYGSQSIMYLEISPHQARQRLEARGRQFEIQHHTVEYLNSINNGLIQLAKARPQFYHIDATQSVEQIVDQIKELM